MDRFIFKDNLDDFITTNESLLSNKNDIKGLVVEFPGFDGNSCLGGNIKSSVLDGIFAQELAKLNVLMIYVFTGPWNWMRDVSVKTVDDIILSTFEKYNLKSDIKVVFTGGSMGGLGTLSYAVKGKFKPISCVVSCPVCDLFAVAKSTRYFASSVYFACAHYNMDYIEAVKDLSPLYFVKRFPKDIEYDILYCDKDDVILPKENAIPLIKKMKENDLKLDYKVSKNTGHCVHTASDIEWLQENMIKHFK